MDRKKIQEIMTIARPAVIATYGRQPLQLIEYHDRLAYQGKAGLDIYVRIQGMGSEFEVEIERGVVTRIKQVGARADVPAEAVSKQITFELLAIIHEQSEAITGLLVKIGLADQGEFYQEAMERHQRTRKKFLKMAANLGWQPEQKAE